MMEETFRSELALLTDIATSGCCSTFTSGHLKILVDIAVSGVYVHPWPLLRELLAHRLDQVLTEIINLGLLHEMYDETSTASLRSQGLEDLEARRAIFRELLLARSDDGNANDSPFTEAAPFTLQRLAEVLADPTAHYRTVGKLMSALEKIIAVTTTVPAQHWSSRSLDPSHPRYRYLMVEAVEEVRSGEVDCDGSEQNNASADVPDSSVPAVGLTAPGASLGCEMEMEFAMTSGVSDPNVGPLSPSLGLRSCTDFGGVFKPVRVTAVPNSSGSTSGYTVHRYERIVHHGEVGGSLLKIVGIADASGGNRGSPPLSTSGSSVDLGSAAVRSPEIDMFSDSVGADASNEGATGSKPHAPVAEFASALSLLRGSRSGTETAQDGTASRGASEKAPNLEKQRHAAEPASFLGIAARSLGSQTQSGGVVVLTHHAVAAAGGSEALGAAATPKICGAWSLREVQFVEVGAQPQTGGEQLPAVPDHPHEPASDSDLDRSMVLDVPPSSKRSVPLQSVMVAAISSDEAEVLPPISATVDETCGGSGAAAPDSLRKKSNKLQKDAETIRLLQPRSLASGSSALLSRPVASTGIVAPAVGNGSPPVSAMQSLSDAHVGHRGRRLQAMAAASIFSTAAPEQQGRTTYVTPPASGVVVPAVSDADDSLYAALMNRLPDSEPSPSLLACAASNEKPQLFMSANLTTRADSDSWVALDDLESDESEDESSAPARSRAGAAAAPLAAVASIGGGVALGSHETSEAAGDGLAGCMRSLEATAASRVTAPPAASDVSGGLLRLAVASPLSALAAASPVPVGAATDADTFAREEGGGSLSSSAVAPASPSKRRLHRVCAAPPREMPVSAQPPLQAGISAPAAAAPTAVAYEPIASPPTIPHSLAQQSAAAVWAAAVDEEEEAAARPAASPRDTAPPPPPQQGVGGDPAPSLLGRRSRAQASAGTAAAAAAAALEGCACIASFDDGEGRCSAPPPSVRRRVDGDDAGATAHAAEHGAIMVAAATLAAAPPAQPSSRILEATAGLSLLASYDSASDASEGEASGGES